MESGKSFAKTGRAKIENTRKTKVNFIFNIPEN